MRKLQDFYGKTLEEGDVIIYSNSGYLDIGQVLKICSSTVKLSCLIEGASSTRSYVYKQFSVKDLSEHNSFFYKYLGGSDFLIRGKGDINPKDLKSRKRIEKEHLAKQKSKQLN